ncbi:MAG: DUF3524 domain-containing protein [Acidimicrobiales bacterium]|nr:DUF3524 domain-containing protein [Acidimicrobiales bacterium]
MSQRRRVLLIEPWLGGSHRAWAEGWRRSSRHHITICGLEAQAWRWRLRGAAVTLAERVIDEVRSHGRPDVLVVSGLVDAASLLGLARRAVADAPVVLYLHENQLRYPRPPGERTDRDPAWANWRSILAADAVWVNSAHHLDVLRTELPALLAEAPDHDHLHLLGPALARMEVHPVGVDLSELRPAPTGEASAARRPVVVWNQRWEHDKNPNAVVRALARCRAAGLEFDAVLAGQPGSGATDLAERARSALGERLVHVGPLERSAYVAALRAADVVVSAALHEYFGVAVVEAMSAGCVPVLPDRCSYPELVPEHLRSIALYGDGQLGAALTRVLSDIDAARRSVEGLSQWVGRFDWSEVAPRDDDALDQLVGTFARG